MKMLPRLQAEERLAAIDVALMGSGGFEPHEARRTLEGLRAQARGESLPRPKAASPAQLGAIGIGVRVVPASAGATHG